MDPEQPRVFAFGEFLLDVSRRHLLMRGERVPLTPKAFDALLYFVEHRGAVLSRDELVGAVWPDVVVEENNLAQAISKLRQVLGETPGDNRYIVTVPGRGYRFVADVTPRPDEAEPVDQAAAATATSPRSQASNPSAALTRFGRQPLTLRRLRPYAVILTALTLSVLSVIGFVVSFARDDDSATAARPRTLAVLPFQPLVPERGDDALEFGMADSLIMKLGHIQELTIRPLATVRRFHDPSHDPFAAGRDLGVEAVLEGYVHRADDRIRVTARLVQVANGRQLWAGQYDEPLTNIFGIQDAISERVARELAIRLTNEEVRHVKRRYTENATAWDLYQKGRFFLSLAQPHNAIETLEQAVRLDQGFAPALAALADTLSRLPIATDSASTATMPRARALAQKALGVDRDLGEAYTVLGWIGFYYDWDWPASEQNFRHALAINGNDFSARLGYAHLLSNTHRSEEAIRQVDLALAAEPLSPLAGTLRSQFLFNAGRFAEARDQLQRTLQRSPGFWIAQMQLGQMYLRERRYDDAIAVYEKAGGAGGTWAPRALAGYAHAVAGHRERAEQILAELLGAGELTAPPSLIAMVHIGLGDRRAALAWLDRAFAERDVRMVFLGVDSVWNSLREEKRFTQFLSRMDLANTPRQ